MRSGPCPLIDKIALFHHGLWTTHIQPDVTSVWDALVIYRRKGLGGYRDFAQAMAVTPMMLQWLNNATNVAPGAFNENFGRELMELFTMGNGTFTQSDVTAMTRAWSGHNVDPTGTRYQFYPQRHDAGLKTLFGITKGWNGPDALDEILLGSKAVVSSEYYVSRLWSFLAYPSPEPSLVAALAGQFRADGLHVGRLVKRIFLRPRVPQQQGPPQPAPFADRAHGRGRPGARHPDGRGEPDGLLRVHGPDALRSAERGRVAASVVAGRHRLLATSRVPDRPRLHGHRGALQPLRGA